MKATTLSNYVFGVAFGILLGQVLRGFHAMPIGPQHVDAVILLAALVWFALAWSIRLREGDKG